MCGKYFDIRAFGAVMTTGGSKDKGENDSEESADSNKGKKGNKQKKEVKNAGQVRGPAQMTFGRSIDPVIPQEHTITRMAVTKEEEESNERTMGQKYTIPYGLYLAYGFVSPQLAAQTGFSQDDLDFFFKALVNMFDFDHSAARGMMATRRLIVFKHADPLGNAPAWKLFDLVSVAKKDGVENPRAFSDYQVTVDEAGLPAGVEIVQDYDVK